MTSETEEVHAISQVLYRYCSALDERNWSALDMVFTPDASVEFTGLAPLTDGVLLVGALRERLDQCSATFHAIMNSQIDIAGDRAQALSKFRVWHERSLDGRTFEALGHYSDILVRGVEGWRISRRKVLRSGVIGDAHDFFAPSTLDMHAAPRVGTSASPK